MSGEQIPYYKATQKQRQLKNEIRKQKRAVQILEKAGQDTKNAKTKLATAQKRLNDFCKETGLPKDYSRIKIATNKLTTNEQNSINKYISSDFYAINEKLRKKQKLSVEEINLVANLDSALNKLPKYKGLVSRSLELNKEELKKFLMKHQLNKKVIYDAYTSTTCGERYNNNSNVELYIYSQNGKNMIKYNGKEQEILYKRNSKFIVKEIEFKNNIYHVLLEEANE